MNIWANAPVDSLAQLRLQNLAKKMKLKLPRLGIDEYEIRIWHKVALLEGDAHTFYVVSKTAQQLDVQKFVIPPGKRGYKHTIRIIPKNTVSDTLWNQLLRNGILNLPAESIVFGKVHPKPKKDWTYVVMENDGSASIHAKKSVRSVWILDGEGYSFEVFSTNGYQNYTYDNPKGYAGLMPKVIELQKIVAILNDLDNLFQSSN